MFEKCFWQGFNFEYLTLQSQKRKNLSFQSTISKLQVRACSVWVSLRRTERLLPYIFLDFYRTRTKYHIYPIVLIVSGGVNGTCFVNEKNNGKGIFLRLLSFYLKPRTTSLLV